MSDQSYADFDERRIHTEGAAFSDRCANPYCGHSRAEHLVSPQALNVHAVSDCNVSLCTEAEVDVIGSDGKLVKVPHVHGEDCVPKACICERFI